MSNKIGRVSATVLGLIAGILHGIIGIVSAIVIFLFGSLTSIIVGALSDSFSVEGFEKFDHLIAGAAIIVGIIVFFVALLNLIGGCIVRSSRVAGGVLMLITSIPILLFAGFIIWTAPGSVVLLIPLLITGLMSFTAAILAFVPYSARYKQLYMQRKQKKFNRNAQPQQPYQQYPPQQQPYQPYQPQQQPPQQQPPTAPPPPPVDDNKAE